MEEIREASRVTRREARQDRLRRHSPLDELLRVAQSALTVIMSTPPSSRPDPGNPARSAELSPVLGEADKRHAAGLMRVNHVGEICAQALYEAQSMATRDENLRTVFQQAAVEEADHLAWTRRRVEELGGRVSALVPLWYAGAFGIGLVAALVGDRPSLGFMAETERQVEDHLLDHLQQLPPHDTVSRAIVEQMKLDEVGHANTALACGGVELPLPVRLGMKAVAKVMTTTAYYL